MILHAYAVYSYITLHIANFLDFFDYLHNNHLILL